MAFPFPSVTLLFYHGGYISEGPRKMYVGGNVSPINVEPDLMSYIEVKGFLKELECPDDSEIYYKAPNKCMDDRLVGLTCDKNVFDMFQNNGLVIDLYVHNPLREHSLPSGQEVSGLTKDDGALVLDDYVLDEGVIPAGPAEGSGSDDESNREWNSGDDTESDSFSGFDESDDEEVEEEVHMVITEQPIEIMNEEGELSDKSDDLGCLSSPEDEDLGGQTRKQKFIEFDEARDMKNPKLLEGMIFPNVIAFRNILKEFHIRERWEYSYVMNESTRVTVICNDKCGFRLHASPMHGEKSFQITKINANHCCIRKYTNQYATSKWIANKYLEELCDEPDKKVKTLKKDVRREWMLDVSKKKAYRAKRDALQVIQGNHKEQYLRLRDSCEVLRKFNPRTTAKLKVERPWIGSKKTCGSLQRNGVPVRTKSSFVPSFVASSQASNDPGKC